MTKEIEMETTYDYILNKINGLKTQYPSLRLRPDDYVFPRSASKQTFIKILRWFCMKKISRK